MVTLRRAGTMVLAFALVASPSALAGTRAFPVTVKAANGTVTVQQPPVRIVSLSPTATEDLFAIGAGKQVVAVDDQSSYPKQAPRTSLSGYTPNAEAIASYNPDLVVVSDRVAEPFWAAPGGPVFRHSATYAGHATCCAAALANLELLERDGLLHRGQEMEGVLLDALRPLAEHPAAGEVRGGMGTLAAVTLDAELLARDPASLGRLASAISVGVVVDIAGDRPQRRRRHGGLLTKIPVAHRLAGDDRYRVAVVVCGSRLDRSRRKNFADFIAAGRQIEMVLADRSRRRGHFTGIETAVVVGIDIHKAGQARGLEFAEIIVDAAAAGGEIDVRDLVVDVFDHVERRRARDRARGLGRERIAHQPAGNAGARRDLLLEVEIRHLAIGHRG